MDGKSSVNPHMGVRLRVKKKSKINEEERPVDFKKKKIDTRPSTKAGLY